jgi:hypothetical protein
MSSVRAVPVVKIRGTVTQLKTQGVHVCVVCGRDFPAQRKSRAYCSNACRVKAYRGRKKLTENGGAP